MSFFEFFKLYFKEKILFIIINIFALIFSAILLLTLGLDIYPVIFIIIINFISTSIYHIYDFIRKFSFYNEVYFNMENLDKKYLVTEVVKEPSFIDGKVMYDVIRQCNKDMIDEVAQFKINISEYREYIELWVHEIKTPIASCKLLLENNQSEITESIDEEMIKVENYIEQALFYARSNDIEKDYLIREVSLQDAINNVIRRNANILISNKVKIDIKDINKKVFSDSKWVEFILHQIVSNSIKYMNKDEKKLTFTTKKVENGIILYIIDNGIGMNERDIIKAFEKGYTGENGRKYGKSTGFGLYLCKKLCNKLGLSIKLKSKIENGTEVSILFPINDFMLV